MNSVFKNCKAIKFLNIKISFIFVVEILIRISEKIIGCDFNINSYYSNEN